MLTYKKVKDKYMPYDRYTQIHCGGMKRLTKKEVLHVMSKHPNEGLEIHETSNEKISENRFKLLKNGKLWEAQLLHPNTKEPIGRKVQSIRYKEILEMLLIEQQAIIADLNNKIAATGSTTYTISSELKIEESK